MRILIAAVFAVGLASPAFAEVELEIGPDTTVIDGPLRPDGTIDYLAHMNALMSAGVTPENNFAVDLVRTMGDDAWSDIWPEAELAAVPDLLGIEPAEIGRWPFVPPRRFVDEQTDWESVDLEFFSLPEDVRQKIREGSLSREDVDWRDYRPYGPSPYGPNPDEIDAEAARQEAFEEFVRDFEDQLWDAVDQPWSPDEHPEVHQWLKRNAEALDRIVSGSTSKPMFYIPLLDSSGGRDGLYHAWAPQISHRRPVGYALLARAQLAVHEHRLDDAWRDLQVIYTLGRQIGKTPDSFGFISPLAIQRKMSLLIDNLAESSQLTGDRARKFIEELGPGPDPALFTDLIDTRQRFDALSMAMAFARVYQQRKAGNREAWALLPWGLRAMVDREELPPFDLSRVLVEINRVLDCAVTLSRIKPIREKVAALEAFEKRLDDDAEEAGRAIKGDPAAIERISEAHEDWLSVAIAREVAGTFYVTRASLVWLQAASRTEHALSKVALALGGYHAEHGRFPEDLHALVPGFLGELPTDFATGALPVYRVEDGVAIVYSLGVNRRDDGGVSDGRHDKDDIAFRIER